MAVRAEISPAPPQRQQGRRRGPRRTERRPPSSPLRFHLDGARSEGPRAAHLGPVPAEVTLGQGDQRGRRFSSSEPLVVAAAAAPHGSRTQPRSPESALSPGLDSLSPRTLLLPESALRCSGPTGTARSPPPKPAVRPLRGPARPAACAFKKQVPVPSGTTGL